MRSLRFTLPFILVAATTLSAQQVICQLGGGPSSYNPYWNAPPTPYASSELGTIYRLLCPNGCGRADLVQNATVSNAMATVVSPGVTLISYNPYFMNNVFTMTGAEASFGILAHEFGHHIDLNTTPSWMNNSWSAELKADAWCGCALARRGFNPAQISVALQAIAAFPSPSHPAWNLRIPAVQQGFLSCGGRLQQLPWGPR